MANCGCWLYWFVGSKKIRSFMFWSKNYFGRYNDLDMFFKFITDKYHDKIEFVKKERLLDFKLLPADIPIAEKIIELEDGL